MPVWSAASVLYFIYIALAALARPGLSGHTRLRVAIVAAAGSLLSFTSLLVSGFWLHDLVLPGVLLLVGYWASGLLWVRPMPRAEAFLASFDAAFGLPQLATRLPRLLCDVLEAAYLGVYPLIPVAVFVHLAWSPHADAERFWSVILVTDYVCFAMLPWIQTRPPRAIEPGPPCRSRVRALNLTLLGRASIGANTVPSGHAAEALAVALLLADAQLTIAISAAGVAVAISAGAVLGRYHYALDVFAGWAVAWGTWRALGN
jgi:membrane-associated phospholipid phosphatase